MRFYRDLIVFAMLCVTAFAALATIEVGEEFGACKYAVMTDRPIAVIRAACGVAP